MGLELVSPRQLYSGLLLKEEMSSEKNTNETGLWTGAVALPCPCGSISGMRPLPSHSCCHTPKVFLYFTDAQYRMALSFGKQAINIIFLVTKFQPSPSSSTSTQFKSMVSFRHRVADVNASLSLGHICKLKSCLVHCTPASSLCSSGGPACFKA